MQAIRNWRSIILKTKIPEIRHQSDSFLTRMIFLLLLLLIFPDIYDNDDRHMDNVYWIEYKTGTLRLLLSMENSIQEYASVHRHARNYHIGYYRIRSQRKWVIKNNILYSYFRSCFPVVLLSFYLKQTPDSQEHHLNMSFDIICYWWCLIIKIGD